MAAIKQSTAYTRMFFLVLSSDHVSPATGLSPTVSISKAGGAFATAGGTVTELAGGTGWYKIALTTTDTGTLGDLAFHITVATADNTDFVDQVTTNILGDTLPANVTQCNGSTVANGAIPNAAAGASGGLFIAGSNAATTISGLTTGALSCTTFTASGAVAFQSTFAVTTSTSLAALSATTVTASGAVALQSTLAITGTTTFTGAVAANSGVTFTSSTGSGLTISSSGGNGNGLTITGNGTGDGISATGGATGRGLHAIGGATSGAGIRAEGQGGNSSGMELVHFGSGSDLAATTTPLTLAKTTNITGFNDIAATAIVTSGAITTNGGKVSGVILVDTLTTYTNNTPQTGDSYAQVVASQVLIQYINDLLEGDEFIDTGVNPWHYVIMKKGGGGLHVGTELLRKRLADTTGAAITNATTVLGSKSQLPGSGT